MEFACMIVGWALISLGILGCFVNKIPGPLLAFAGLLLQVFGCDISVEWWVLALVALLVIASMVVSKKLLPKVGKLVAAFGKAGSWGTTVGSLVGLMLFAACVEDGDAGLVVVMMILAFIVLPYVFAFLFELVARRSAKDGLQAAVGALVTFAAGTVLKLAVCIYVIYAVITNM